MNIKDTIKRLMGIGFSVDEALELAGGSVTDTAIEQPRTFAGRKLNPFLVNGDDARTATDKRYEPVFPDSDRESVPPIKRRKRHYRPRVAYQLTKLATTLSKGGGTAKQRAAFGELYPVAADVLKAVAKSKTPLSNRDIEKVTEHGRKSVESSVYQLRHFGLIESVSIADTK